LIVVLSVREDPHASVIGNEFDHRGAPWLLFDPADLPTSAELSTRIGCSGSAQPLLRLPNRQIDLADVAAVYLRRPGHPRPPEHLSQPESAFVAEETERYVVDLWDSLDVFMFPAPRAVILRAQLRLRQLRLAGDLGFELPDTVVGNDPDRVWQLYRDHGGRLVSKKVGQGAFEENRRGERVLRYTEPIRPRDLAFFTGIRHCPVIVQEAIPKRLELRVTVVASRVFAAAIYSQDSHHTKHDWRHYDQATTRIQPWQLPRELEARCVALVRRLDLWYGAIDLILTPDGRYVFLEINPAGQYLWIEDATGQPITSAIADLLIAARPPADGGCQGNALTVGHRLTARVGGLWP
jgi:glutathione synthase/RimK-type ligase-like ATP-grasp enzyme